MTTRRSQRWWRSIGFPPKAVGRAAICLVATLPLSALAQDVRVGIYENPPKIFTGRDGTPSGIMIELLEEIARREGWRLVFVDCEWQACLEQLATGSIDLMPDVAHTEVRSGRFDFHHTPALHSWSQVYRNPAVAIGSILDLQGKRIAMLTGSVQEEALLAMLSGFEIDFEIVVTAAPEEAFEMAASGKADAAVASHQFGAFRAPDFNLVETPIVFLPSRLFYATAPGRNAELLAGIDRHLDAWQDDVDSPYYAIIKHWGGRIPDARVPPLVRNALLALAGLGVALAAGLVLMRRQVAARTRDVVAVNRRLTATLDAIPDPLFELDLDGRCLDVHTTRSDALAAPPDTLKGRTVREVIPEHAAEECMRALREAEQAGWSGGRKIELSLANEPRWFELSVAKKASESTERPSFIVLSRDVTDRHLAEAGVKRLTRLYATLSQCNQAIVRCTDQAELLRQICQAAVTFGEMKMVWIGLVDDEDRLVKPVASYGEGTDYLDDLQISMDADNPLGRGPTGVALRTDQPYWCQDFANDPATAPWHERGRTYGWRASAALPLHRDGAVIGIMNLYAGEVNAFDESARNLLVEMATDIDFALNRFLEDAERRRLAAAIVDSEEKYRELAETINDVIWTLDPDTLCFKYVSPSVFRLRGYTPEEIMAEPLDAALTPGGAARIRGVIASQMAEFAAGRRTSDDFSVEEVEQPCKDGTTVWTEVVTNIVRNRKSGKIEIRGVTRDISERKAAEAQIERLAHFDQLTGLPNRSLLKDRFAHTLSLAQRTETPLAVLSLDLDHFKIINDTLGHEAGDAVLIEVGRRLVATLRSGDTVSRMGGDEFIVLLPDTNADGASQAATKLLAAIARPGLVAGQELSVTSSIGISMYPDDGTDMDTLSRNAEAAMYQVKRESHNGLRFFTQELQAHSARALTLVNALRHAIDREQLSLHFQPLLSVNDGRIVGAEALLRWHHPDLGAVSPAEFIPIAENNGMIIPIGEWVLRHAVTEARRWLEQGLPQMVVAVNLSAIQFRDPNLPETISRIVEEIGLPPNQLELELTEAVAMDDPLAAIEIMDRLFERGIHMSIDDFGTGYSSLSYLKRFRANKLKIDQSFVRDIATDADDKAIITAIINLARSLGMLTIAEGVETAGQLEFLRQQGCDQVQGYYLGRPLEPAAFEAFVRARVADARAV